MQPLKIKHLLQTRQGNIAQDLRAIYCLRAERGDWIHRSHWHKPTFLFFFLNRTTFSWFSRKLEAECFQGMQRLIFLLKVAWPDAVGWYLEFLGEDGCRLLMQHRVNEASMLTNLSSLEQRSKEHSILRKVMKGEKNPKRYTSASWGRILWLITFINFISISISQDDHLYTETTQIHKTAIKKHCFLTYAVCLRLRWLYSTCTHYFLAIIP